MKSPILGGFYVASSINAANNRCVNLMPESVPMAGKDPAFLTRCPGLVSLCEVGDGPIRGLHKLKGIMYVVSGSQLYSVDKSYNSTLIGQISGDYQVSMADNGTQIFIASNPYGYIFNSTDNTLSPISDPDFPGSVTVGYLDGRFVFNQPNSQTFWATAIFDGTDIDSLDFAAAEGAPDLLLSLYVDHLEVWLFGENSVEVWYNDGGSDFPFSRIQGAFIETGCSASYSVAKLDNSLFWLGSDDRGNGIIYRANGYVAQRVSNHAIENAIQKYSDLSDAIAYTYQQNGHAFYVITFPTGNQTWVYDASTNLWHERAYFNQGELERHLGRCQLNFNNTIVIGSRLDGNVYKFDLDTYSDNGGIQKWVRSWRALNTGQNNLTRTAQFSLQLDCESGVGIQTGQGSDPQVILRWSDDGGHTWSNEHSRSMGKMGEYYKRVYWRRLGMTEKLRDRVYEISGTDPVKIAIMGAEILIGNTIS